MEPWKSITDVLTSAASGFVLKLVAGLSAAAFGVMGLGTKARDDRGKLTRQGGVALYGLIISFLIGAISATYDFMVSQKAADETRRRNERLLLAAERGIYPLRGINASASIEFPPDIPGLAEYKSQLRHALPGLRNALPESVDHCTGTQEYICDDDTESYDIPLKSRLFPTPSSDFGRVLKYLQIHTALIRLRSDSDKPQFTYIGAFTFDLRDPSARDSMLVFTPSAQERLTYVPVGVRISDRGAMESGVYSLADIFPGAIGASVSYDDHALCDSYDGIKDCGTLLGPLNGGILLKRLKMTFDYPKTLDLDSSKDIECDTPHVGIMIVRLLPPTLDDVEPPILDNDDEVPSAHFVRPKLVRNTSATICGHVERPAIRITPEH
jgi:hypothetical protein